MSSIIPAKQGLNAFQFWQWTLTQEMFLSPVDCTQPLYHHTYLQQLVRSAQGVYPNTSHQFELDRCTYRMCNDDDGVRGILTQDMWGSSVSENI